MIDAMSESQGASKAEEIRLGSERL